MHLVNVKMLQEFHRKVQLWCAGGSRCELRGSLKSVGFILWVLYFRSFYTLILLLIRNLNTLSSIAITSLCLTSIRLSFTLFSPSAPSLTFAPFPHPLSFPFHLCEEILSLSSIESIHRGLTSPQQKKEAAYYVCGFQKHYRQTHPGSCSACHVHKCKFLLIKSTKKHQRIEGTLVTNIKCVLFSVKLDVDVVLYKYTNWVSVLASMFICICLNS